MQTYYAKSVLLSKTLWFNIASFAVALSELTEFTNIIPDSWQGILAAIVAALNLALRMFSVRPVAFVAPNNYMPVKVASIENIGAKDA